MNKVRNGEVDLHSLVMNLVGEIMPIGESRTDANRLENLKELIDLVDLLLTELDEATGYSSNYQSSMKTIGLEAEEALKKFKVYIPE